MKRFTVRETNICKGAACLLLLMHHLFFPQIRWDSYYHIFGMTPPLISYPAQAAKVCVAIFMILSGYGLTKSAQKSGDAGIKFVYRHLVKLLFGFWFVFVIFVPLGFVFGKPPTGVYGGGVKGMLRCFIDFMGIANVVHTPTANATWWFMGDIILLYIFFPLLVRIMKKIPYIALAVSAVLCFAYANTTLDKLAWIFPFITGIFFAQKDLFEKIINHKKSGLIIAGAFLYCVILAIIRLRFALSTRTDTFLGIGVIVFSAMALSRIRYVNTALGFIGKHSANIFMMHTFIYSLYFSRQIYSLWYPILIYAALLGSCLLISMGMEALKRLIRYNKLQSLLLNIGGNKS